VAQDIAGDRVTSQPVRAACRGSYQFLDGLVASSAMLEPPTRTAAPPGSRRPTSAGTGTGSGSGRNARGLVAVLLDVLEA
jgi:hypothetical protein